MIMLVGYEACFPDRDVSQSTIDILKRFGFRTSMDGFYIAQEDFNLFRLIASPYKIAIKQNHFVFGV